MSANDVRKKKTCGKRKLPLAYIDDPLRRKNCFKKRSRGLLKKGLELKILTNSDVSVYMFFPDTDKEFDLDTSDPDVRRLPPDIGKLVKQHTQSAGLATSNAGDKRPFDVVPLSYSPDFGSGASGVEDEVLDDDDDDDEEDYGDESEEIAASSDDGPLGVVCESGDQSAQEQLQLDYCFLQQQQQPEEQLQLQYSSMQQQQQQQQLQLQNSSMQQQQQQLQLQNSFMQQQLQEHLQLQNSSMQEQQQQLQLQNAFMQQQHQQLQPAATSPELMTLMDQPWSVLANGGGAFQQDASVIHFGVDIKGGEIPPQLTIFGDDALFDENLTEEQKSTIFPDFASDFTDFENMLGWL